MYVQLPAATKANILKTGADVQESGLFSGVRNLEDGGRGKKPRRCHKATHVTKPIFTSQCKHRE